MSEPSPSEKARQSVASDDPYGTLPPEESPGASSATSGEAAAKPLRVAAADSSIDSLQLELEQTKDQLLRSQAELENFRKRMRRDLDEQVRFSALPLVRDLLPALDNLERAAQSSQMTASQTQPEASVNNATGLVEGVLMVVDQIESVLSQHHCRKIEATPGTEFDPHLHEAMTQHPSADYPAGTVTQVVATGYQLHDRVVRPAKVMVSSGAPQ